MLQVMKSHEVFLKSGVSAKSVHAPGVTFGLEVITPELAAEYLKMNRKNRRMKMFRVREYISDMLSGQWEWNGSTISFDVDGILIDGQNRLEAIVKSGKAIISMVIRGLPRSAQRTIDTGAKRSVADDLKIGGGLNVNATAAAAKLLCAVPRGLASNNTFSKSDVHRMLDNHPDIAMAVQAVNTKHIKAINIPIVAAWYYCAKYLLEDDTADEALEVLETARERFPDDPMHAFRQRFSNDRIITRNERLRLAGLWTLFRAFDDSKAMVARKTVKLMRTEYRLSGLDYSLLK